MITIANMMLCMTTAAGGFLVGAGDPLGWLLMGVATLAMGAINAAMLRMIHHGVEGVKLEASWTVRDLHAMFGLDFPPLPIYITPGSRIAAVGEVYVCKFDGKRVIMLNAKEGADDSERPIA